MAKTSVLMRPKVDTNSGRHDFDRSYVSRFNQSHGEIRCVFLEPAVAGSKGIVNAKRFTRTAKVVFPAFQQVDQHIEFFKVPLRYLWSKWNDWKLNINDLNSSALVDWPSGAVEPSLGMDFAVPRINFGVQGGQDFLERINPSSGTINLSVRSDVLRFWDDLNLGIENVNSNTRNVLNLFGLAAYQKVYYDHFRNSTYESNNPYAYNLDWLQNAATSAPNVLEPSDGTQEELVTQSLMKIRYKNYRNDYFHSIYPSLNYSQSQPTGQDWTLPNNLQGVSNLINPGILDSFNTGLDIERWTTSSSGVPASNSSVLTANPGNRLQDGSSLIQHDHVVNGSSQLSNNAQINVQQIRAMFALDKLMRASAYAPKHVREQFAARYGVTISDRVSFESERLGSLVNDIVFGEVTATSDTYNSSAGTGQQLGAIGGKGIGASDYGQDIHFYCEEDSLIIGVQYFLARANYDGLGLDDWFTKLTRNDFFIREYEHLGLRPLYRYHLRYLADGTTDNDIVGFQEANMRYKVGVDRNHGLFNTYYYKIDNTGQPVRATSELSAFTVHTNSANYVAGGGGVNPNYFKAFPSALDYIFETNYNKQDMATDQFYGQIRFKFFVNAPMDVHSQPFM